ncbi:MAG: glucosaminidase domain-containing protein [Bacteroidota bacterium]
MERAKNILLPALLCLVITVNAYAQPAERRISRKEYIEMWKDEAQKNMLEYGIPASITLAQGILESADGNSPLARYANNHFGIKCHDGWEGETFIQNDDKANECFRKYETAEQSFHDHSEFLKTRSRYAFLFDLTHDDYHGWAHGLKKAGYATNAQYGYLLVQIIDENELYKYDALTGVAHKQPKTEEQDFSNLNKITHEVKVHDNNLKYIIAKDGDSFYKISKEFELGLWQVYKFNDLSKKDVLKNGDVIYLQPKKNKNKEAKEYRVKNGDSMHSISQKFGVKLKKLYKLNDMMPGTGEPEPGTLIKLKK